MQTNEFITQYYWKTRVMFAPDFLEISLIVSACVARKHNNRLALRNQGEKEKCHSTLPQDSDVKHSYLKQ